MDKVSVFLADWQVLFREGIHFTISGEEDIDVVDPSVYSRTDARVIVLLLSAHQVLGSQSQLAYRETGPPEPPRSHF